MNPMPWSDLSTESKQLAYDVINATAQPHRDRIANETMDRDNCGGDPDQVAAYDQVIAATWTLLEPLESALNLLQSI